MKINIDGACIEALPQDTIMDAARRAGVFIPGLCYCEGGRGNHSCRLCMVEVEERGRNRLVAACAYKVWEDMTVVTTTERVDKIRKTLLGLLYLQSPDNPTILHLMERLGASRTEGLSVKKPAHESVPGCILCGRCAEACAALGAAAISTVSRGVEKRVDTPYGKAAEVCIGCGACAESCPIGVITVQDTQEGRRIWNKDFRWVRCQACGKAIATEEHYAAMEAALKEGEEEGGAADAGNARSREAGPAEILCPSCRRRAITDVFAGSLGE